MEEEQDQVLDGTQKEQSEEEQSQETTKEEITPEKAYDLARGLQKGYTMTRQEISDIRKNLESVSEAVSTLRKGNDDYDFGTGEEPLTKKNLLEILDSREKDKTTESQKWERNVDNQIADLRVKGVISSDKEEEDLLDFAVEHKITDLSLASTFWLELKEARQAKEALRTKTRGEAGSKVGTSEKVGSKEEGVSYSNVHNKDWDEI